MVFKLMFFSPEPLVNTRNNMLCLDGPMGQCYPVVCVSKADDFENIHL